LCSSGTRSHVIGWLVPDVSRERNGLTLTGRMSFLDKWSFKMRPICCFETSADYTRLHGAKSRKQEYGTISPRKPKTLHIASTVGCKTAVPLWFRMCCDTPRLSLSPWAGRKAAAYNLQYSCKYWLSGSNFIKWAINLIFHNRFMASRIRPERQEGKSGRGPDCLPTWQQQRRAETNRRMDWVGKEITWYRNIDLCGEKSFWRSYWFVS